MANEIALGAWLVAGVVEPQKAVDRQQWAEGHNQPAGIHTLAGNRDNQAGLVGTHYSRDGQVGLVDIRCTQGSQDIAHTHLAAVALGHNHNQRAGTLCCSLADSHHHSQADIAGTLHSQADIAGIHWYRRDLRLCHLGSYHNQEVRCSGPGSRSEVRRSKVVRLEMVRSKVRRSEAGSHPFRGPSSG